LDLPHFLHGLTVFFDLVGGVNLHLLKNS
jgi:hypothetical protein